MESLDEATANLLAAVGSLLPVRPQLVAWACTSGSFYRGPGFNAELEVRMTSAASVPSITASSAVLESLQAIGARSVAVLTPYSAEINAHLEAFLGAAGLSVRGMRQLYDDTDMDDFDLQSIAPETLARAAAEADVPDAEALLISCTGVPLVGVVDSLERALGKPVVGSNLALIRSFLRAAGYGTPVSGFGRVIASAAASTGTIS
jgi:maleate cis-trans isomerase